MQYKFNKNGVCLNPEVISITNERYCTCKIKIAQLKNGKWIGGHKFELYQCSSGSPCSGKFNQFNSRYEAVISGMKGALHYAQRNMNNKNRPKFVKAINTFKEDFMQLEFNFKEGDENVS